MFLLSSKSLGSMVIFRFPFLILVICAVFIPAPSYKEIASFVLPKNELLAFAILCIVVCLPLTLNDNDRPPPPFDLFYRDSHFIEVVWNQSSSTSEVYL